MHRHRLVWLLLLGALGGCATLPSGRQLAETGAAELAAAPVCCERIEQAVRRPLPTGIEPVELAIDRTAQAFVLGERKTFFLLFELPAFQRPYSIRLTSLPIGAPPESARFIPRAAVFDAAFKPTRQFDEKVLRSRGDGLEMTVFVNPQDAGERYLAVFGGDASGVEARTHSTVTATPVIAGPVLVTVIGGADSRVMLYGSMVGTLRVEVLGLTEPPHNPR